MRLHIKSNHHFLFYLDFFFQSAIKIFHCLSFFEDDDFISIWLSKCEWMIPNNNCDDFFSFLMYIP